MWNLLWKEWREQSWKLAFGCIVLGAMAWIGLRSRIVPDERMCMSVCFIGLALLPVLASTGLIPAERIEGAFDSLLALPTTARAILFAKTIVGLILCAGPLLVAMCISLLAAANREISTDPMLILYLRTILATLSLFIWSLALTARLPSETRASLIAIGILIFWTLATLGLSAKDVPKLAVSFSPLAFVYGYSSAFISSPPFIMILMVQLICATLLWFWTSTRLAAPIED